jgi:glycosyltransferase involved in cell wall biosynthesis
MKISVVIATYNRSDSLKQVLNQLLVQEVPADISLDVVVVDNNSKDNTRQVVESYIPLFSRRLSYLFEGRQGKPFALNLGIKESHGDFVAFTDDDVNLDKKWLGSLAECFKKNDCDGVGGRVLPIYPDNTPQWLKDYPHQAAGIVVIYDVPGESRKLNPSSMDLFIGANFAFRRSVLEECGLFRTDLIFGKVAVGEDLELIERLIKRNKVLYFSTDVQVWHPVDLQRARLNRVGQWHIALGMFAARMESETNEKFTCMFGVPRYILKGLFKEFFLMVVSMFNWMAFFKHYRSFYRFVGMVKEYRKQYAK